MVTYIRGEERDCMERLLESGETWFFPDKPTGTIEVAAMGSVTTLLRNIMPVGGEKPWLTLP
jgi:hypothetical protein